MDTQRITHALQHASRMPEVARCVGAVESGWSVAAAYVGLTPLQVPRRVRFRSGLEYQLREFYDLETLWQINFHRVYPLHPSDAVIVDAGANVGLFACWAAHSNPRSTVIAIEPSPANLTRLHEHVRVNGLVDRVRVIPAALSATREPVWFSSEASASQMHHVVAGPAPNALAVEALTIAELFAALPYPGIDFLKMDIEGSEYDVLLAAPPDQLRAIRRLTVEYHAAPNRGGRAKESLRQHLVAAGFDVVDTHPHAEYGIFHARRR
jgi:FkbM family methyltransferase